MENASETIIHIAPPPWEWADNILYYLDPSLFQNVILIAAAIYIPFILNYSVPLTGINKNTDELKSMIFYGELFPAKRIFGVALISTFIFSFASGIDSPSWMKLLFSAIAICIIAYFWKSLHNILTYSRGNEQKREIPFLEKLKLPYKNNPLSMNKATPEKMIKGWSSLWNRTNIDRESEFTKIFISHMDDAITNNQIELAAEMSSIYLKNIDNRDSNSISYDALPKFLVWHEQLWKLEEKNYSNVDVPVNTIDIRRSVFEALADKLLKSKGLLSRYKFFSEFEQHINQYKQRYDATVKEDVADQVLCEKYITECFDILLPIFLEELQNAGSIYNIKNYSFPVDWKITSANSNNIVARIVSKYFIKWAGDRAFYYSEIEEPDSKHLKLVIHGLLPNIHPYLFRTFLILFYYSKHIQAALAIKTNIPVWYPSVGALDATNIPEADIIRKFDELEKKQDTSQKEETIQVILNFYNWHRLSDKPDSFSEDQINYLNNSTEEEKQDTLYEMRKNKLKNLKEELKSAEIIKFCTEGTIEESKAKEIRRTEFLELTDLLLKAIEKPA